MRSRIIIFLLPVLLITFPISQANDHEDFSPVDEVLKHALTKTLKPVKWAEIDQASSKKDEVTSRH